MLIIRYKYNGNGLNIGTVHDDFCNVLGYPAGSELYYLTFSRNQGILSFYSHLEYLEGPQLDALTTQLQFSKIEAIQERKANNNEE